MEKLVETILITSVMASIAIPYGLSMDRVVSDRVAVQAVSDSVARMDDEILPSIGLGKHWDIPREIMDACRNDPQRRIRCEHAPQEVRLAGAEGSKAVLIEYYPASAVTIDSTGVTYAGKPYATAMVDLQSRPRAELRGQIAFTGR
jgi:hypothetical protein